MYHLCIVELCANTVISVCYSVVHLYHSTVSTKAMILCGQCLLLFLSFLLALSLASFPLSSPVVISLGQPCPLLTHGSLFIPCLQATEQKALLTCVCNQTITKPLKNNKYLSQALHYFTHSVY